MNSRQRVIAAFERKKPDRVPHFELVIDSMVIDKIVPGADIFDFIDKMGIDAIAVRPNVKIEKLDENNIKDENGTIRQRTTQDYFEPVNQVIKDESDLKKFDFPDPYASYRFDNLKKAIERFKGKVAVVSFMRDGWSEARDLHGFAQSLIDLIDRPKLVRGILEKAVDYYSELGKLSAELGVDIAFSGDDIAGTNGLLMDPVYYREILYPPIKRLYKNWKKYGLYILKHSDGNLYPVIDLLIDAGMDCLNPIDPTAGMSLAKVKEEYGSKICIMGNVNCAGNLVFGTEEDVIEEVKRCIDIASPGGGYICSSSNSIPRDVKPQNYVAMINTIKEYGKYA
jgi:uroporphyrinogen decarboxylase